MTERWPRVDLWYVRIGYVPDGHAMVQLGTNEMLERGM